MGFIKKWKQNINKYQEFFFNLFILITYIVYLSIAIGLLPKYPSYLNNFNKFVHIYICLFLLYRFNPFRKIKCTSLDRKIVFSSGILLFTTFVLNKPTIDFFKEKLKIQ
jgi:hypothetical protein